MLLDCTDGEQRHRPLEVHIGPLFRPYLGPEPRPRVTASAALRRLRSRRRITYKKTTSLLIGNKQRSTGENRGRSGTGSGSVLSLVELGDHLVRERFHLHGHLRPLAQHVVLHMRNSTRTSGGTSLRCHVSSGGSSDVSSGASSGEGEVQAEMGVLSLTALRTPSTTGLPSSKALIFPGLTHRRPVVSETATIQQRRRHWVGG